MLPVSIRRAVLVHLPLSHCDLPGPRDTFKRDTVDLAPRAIEGAGGVFSQ